ncbi:MAG: hypothetical protein DVB31_09585, partial [Verrucomicrobia bacterium]
GDGTILMGGSFAVVNGVGHVGLVRLLSDGSLDPSFDLQLNGTVRTLAYAPGGKLLVGGDFTSAAGELRNRVARFNTDGTLDASFDPAAGPNSTVRSLAVQPDGKVVIGGGFSDVNGSGRSYLCRLGANGLPDFGFVDGSFNNQVYAVALQPDGKMLVGGDFTQVNGASSSGLVRLRLDGTTDPSFVVGTGANSTVFALALQPDGSAIVGGNFTVLNGLSRVRLARVLGQSTAAGGEIEFGAATYSGAESLASVAVEIRRHGATPGGVAVTFTTSNGTANAADYTAQTTVVNFAAGETTKTVQVALKSDLVQEDDETVNLTLTNPTGGSALGSQRTAVLYILNDDNTTAVGGVDSNYEGSANGPVRALARQTDGKMVVVGDYSSLAGQGRLRVGRMNADGTIDAGFDPAAWVNNAVYAAAVQPDGGVVVGGAFTLADGFGRTRVARFNADGSLDQTFNIGTGPNNDVFALLVQGDGTILMGGSFAVVNGVGHMGLVRLLSDGSLDPSFDLQINGTVRALAYAPDGKLLVGGDFTSAGGELRNRVARFNTDGTLDPDFDPASGPNSSVRSLAVQPDGKVVIGGGFSDVNGSGRSYLCRLGVNGLPDFGFVDGAFNNQVYAVGLQPDGKIVAGGDFSQVNGASSSGLVRLRQDGTTDPSFVIGTGANNTVYALALQPDGSAIIGGNFTVFNGLTQMRLARVLGRSAATGGEIEFSAATYSGAESLANVAVEIRRNGATPSGVAVTFTASNGTANAADYTAQTTVVNFAAGETKKTVFVALKSDLLQENDETVNLALTNPTGGAALGSQRTAVLYILNDDNATTAGGVDSNYVGSSDGSVRALARQTDGKMVVAGNFANLVGQGRLRIGRLNPDGTPDGSFDPSAWLNNAVYAVALQSDGAVLVGGAFTIADGVGRTRVARFNADGSLDHAFSPGLGPNNDVYALLVQGDGSILVGGAFGTVNGQGHVGLAKLLSDGSLDPAFDLQINGTVRALAFAPDGKLVVGGDFTSAGGVKRNRIARFRTDGSIDPAFDPSVGPNSTVRSLVVQSDGKVVIGGSFNDFNNGGHPYLCRLGTDGLLDAGFASAALNNVVYAVAMQGDGKLMAGGDFTQASAQPSSKLVRLRVDGTVDPDFNIGTGGNDTVFAVAPQPDGSVVIGGDFTVFNGLNRIRVARLIGSGGGQAFHFTSIVPSGGQILMSGTGSVGQHYQLQYSTDLKAWTDLAGKTASAPTIDFADPSPVDPHRCYRVLAQ